MEVLELNKDNFKEIDNKIAVLKFWAPWCGPCVRYAPIFKEVAAKINDEEIIFAEVNIDDDSDGFFTKKFEIKSIPMTIVLNKESVEVSRINGSLSVKDLEEFLSEAN